MVDMEYTMISMRLFTIKFDSILQQFNDKDLQDFIKDKDIRSVKDRFFFKDGTPYMVVTIIYNQTIAVDNKTQTEYRNEKIEKKTEEWKKIISEKELPLFNTLREWRNKEAAIIGKPPYIICNNLQLAEMISLSPTSLADLNKINGFGETKIKKYGVDILKIISSSNVNSNKTESSKVLSNKK